MESTHWDLMLQPPSPDHTPPSPPYANTPPTEENMSAAQIIAKLEKLGDNLVRSLSAGSIHDDKS